MPDQRRFRFYRGQPVKRMREGRKGIILTFVSVAKGIPGRQQTVTQAEWDSHGEWREVQSTKMDDLRALVSS